MQIRRSVLVCIAMLALGLILTACAADAPCPVPVPCPDCPEATCPEPEPCPEATCPEPESCPDCPSSVEAPFEALWLTSAHADAEAEAFVHWNEDDPPEVPTSCAKCHSTYGFQDFLGADGTAAGVVDNAAEIGSVVTCVACHNDATLTLDSVTFPSGLEVTGLGDEARCMQCHQGRASTVSVNGAIEKTGLTDMDASHEELGFINIHYFAAAATQFGTQAQGGYEYEGKAYDVKFAHVEGFDACIDCHDSHTLEIKVQDCTGCHSDVASVDDLKNVRMQGSLKDYDGDGNVEEGIYYEIESLQEILYSAMQAYAEDATGTPIVYSASAYPYFFADTNGSGEHDEGDESYAGWTGRLLKAAYNYQTSKKDPGAFAHGGKYIIELLYDSIEDLDAGLVEGLTRIDAGHFASSQEAFRHWDEDGEVPATCAKCHSDSGLPTFLKNGATIAVEPASSFRCATCHDQETFEPLVVESVTFPSGAKLDSGNPTSNICLNCHQGRESTVSVDRSIGDLAADEVSESLRFRNVHYFAAGATLFGGEAQGAYQYAGNEYIGKNAHIEGFNTCVDCHGEHSLEVQTESCNNCHGIEDPMAIRMSDVDYDGDGDTEEGLAAEINTLHEALYAALQDYAANVAGTPILYDAYTYPYFMTDNNGNGVLDEDDGGYAAWTPRLLRAAYNYQYVAKDPGAFAHNGEYIIQVLYDSLSDLGESVSVDMTGMTRP